MNDNSNASSPAIPSVHKKENGSQNHPTKRKLEDTDDNDNDNGNDENSEKDSLMQDEYSNSAFDINEDSNMTSFNGDETNDGEELESSFDSHAIEQNGDSNVINEDSEPITEDGQTRDGDDSNVATSVVSEESATLTYRLGMGMLREDEASQDSYTNNSQTAISNLPSGDTISSFSAIKESSNKPNTAEISKKDDTQKPKNTDTGNPPPLKKLCSADSKDHTQKKHELH